MKEEYEKKLVGLREEHEEAERKHQIMLEEVKENQEKLWNELKEEFVNQLASVMDDIAAQKFENEQQMQAEAERVDGKLKDSGMC